MFAIFRWQISDWPDWPLSKWVFWYWRQEVLMCPPENISTFCFHFCYMNKQKGWVSSFYFYIDAWLNYHMKSMQVGLLFCSSSPWPILLTPYPCPQIIPVIRILPWITSFKRKSVEDRLSAQVLVWRLMSFFCGCISRAEDIICIRESTPNKWWLTKDGCWYSNGNFILVDYGNSKDIVEMF